MQQIPQLTEHQLTWGEISFLSLSEVIKCQLLHMQADTHSSCWPCIEVAKCCLLPNLCHLWQTLHGLGFPPQLSRGRRARKQASGGLGMLSLLCLFEEQGWGFLGFFFFFLCCFFFKKTESRFGSVVFRPDGILQLSFVVKKLVTSLRH